MTAHDSEEKNMSTRGTIMSRTSASSDRTVGGIVAERPSRALVFERLGIDYCCGGRKPFAVACAEKGLSPSDVLREVAASDAAEAAQDRASEMDWTRAPLGKLCDHIIHQHHAYIRRALPRVSELTRKVADAHGDWDERLLTVRDVFAAFRAEMEGHTIKEEVVLFPLIRRLDDPDAASAESVGPGVSAPIARMTTEHDDAGAVLAQMRALTDGYAPPQGACPTYRALLDSLFELEADTHRHVHLENNVLFPRALEIEARSRLLPPGTPAESGSKTGKRMTGR
jgi:regulator of cell morphogenesis and NO signaling